MLLFSRPLQIQVDMSPIAHLLFTRDLQAYLCCHGMFANFTFRSGPCIRGHRTTKCSHAKERLMIVVKKPGRPLSSCPHPRDNPCECQHITAAIPKDKACRCGSEPPPASSEPPPEDPNSIINDLSARIKTSFKVQKGSSKPPSNWNQPFDPANFVRMDMNSINIVQFEQRSQNTQMPFQNGYATSPPPESYGYKPQYASGPPQYTQFPVQAPADVQGFPTMNEFSTGPVPQISSEHIAETSLVAPTNMTNGDPMAQASCCAPLVTSIENEWQVVTNTDSTPHQLNHDYTSSNERSSFKSQDSKIQSCCLSKSTSEIPSHESQPDVPMSVPHDIPAQKENSFDPALYPQYVPQPTVFTYPAGYGSFEHPLQASDWSQRAQANDHTMSPTPSSAPSVSFATPVPTDSFETIHTCGCGDGCQCIGCAAHPYNDATKDHVRSAWIGQESNEGYTNEMSTSNESISASTQSQGIDPTSSSAAHTPPSSTSGNLEEQVLSAADFFFVDYNLTSDMCGGSTATCPCGDDCECPGCDVHNGRIAETVA